MPEIKEEPKEKIDTRVVASGLVDVFSESTSCSGNGGGIGDLVLLMSLLPGIQEKCKGKTLRVIANRKDWLGLGYDGLVVNWDEYNDSGVKAELSIYHFSNWWCQYDLEAKAMGLTRHQYFGRRFHVEPQHPKLKLRIDALAWARKELGGALKEKTKLVGIFPFSTSKQREWPDQHWVELIEALQKDGYAPVMVAGPGDDKRSEFYPCMRYWGINAVKTAAMLSLFSLGIGNDSGMAHISAALDRPTIVIGAPTEVERIFSFYKDVTPIQGVGECSGCLWRKEGGYRHSCTYGCNLMYDLKPSVVTEAARTILKRA